MILKGEAAFMDNHPGICLALFDSIHDSIKGHHDCLAVLRKKQLKEESGGCVLAWDGYPPGGRSCLLIRSRNQERTAASSESRTRIEHGVVALHMA